MRVYLDYAGDQSMGMTNLQMEGLLAPTYKVGVYCRLSKEDEDSRDGESQSIGHTSLKPCRKAEQNIVRTGSDKL